MKRQDIEVGVEYAATAPLAYGREPNTTARKVRFTSNQAGPWWRVITLIYSATGSAIDNGPAWVTDSVELVRAGTARAIEVREMPGSFARVRLESPKIGAKVTYLDTTIKGGLPAEVWNSREGEWVTGLIPPAEIHRTWADVQAAAEAKREQEAEYDKAARVAELRGLLSLIGLGGTFRVSRSGSGSTRVAIESLGRDGDALLAELTAWAQDHGLIAKVET